jgi:hypothetical protein
MYQVSPDQFKNGEALITINELYDITGIGIYGFPMLAVPESGSAALLFGLAAACVFCIRVGMNELGRRVSFPRGAWSSAARQEAHCTANRHGLIN